MATVSPFYRLKGPAQGRSRGGLRGVRRPRRFEEEAGITVVLPTFAPAAELLRRLGKEEESSSRPGRHREGNVPTGCSLGSTLSVTTRFPAAHSRVCKSSQQDIVDRDELLGDVVGVDHLQQVDFDVARDCVERQIVGLAVEGVFHFVADRVQTKEGVAE